MNRIARAVLAALLTGPFTLPVHAAPGWSVRAGSTLGFTATWEGSGFDGVFHRFTADIVFSPEDLAGSRFKVEVDVTSADTQSSDRDEALAEPDWFDYAKFPHATFRTTGFRALEGGGFEASGTLDIKGHSKAITIPIRWQQQGATARLQGETVLKRTDFGVGEGDWATGDTIGLDVQVRFDLALDAAADGN